MATLLSGVGPGSLGEMANVPRTSPRSYLKLETLRVDKKHKGQARSTQLEAALCESFGLDCLWTVSDSQAGVNDGIKERRQDTADAELF